MWQPVTNAKSNMFLFYNLGPSQKTILTATLSFPNFFLFLHKPKAHAKKGELVVWKKVVIVVVVVDMSSERLIACDMLQSEGVESRSHSTKQCCEPVWIFEELPKATIVSVSRPDTGDFSPMLLSYTIEFHYKQACTNSLFGSLSILVLFA